LDRLLDPPVPSVLKVSPVGFYQGADDFAIQSEGADDLVQQARNRNAVPFNFKNAPRALHNVDVSEGGGEFVGVEMLGAALF
jgi:hypothetical protein